MQPKIYGQGIMTLELLLLFDQLNLLSLSFEKQAKVIKKLGFTMIEVVEIFEYKKNNNKY